MCWCTAVPYDAQTRLPCCGCGACHDAARRAGVLGGNDADCVTCFPPAQPPRGSAPLTLTGPEVITLRAELLRLRDEVAEQRSRADAAEAAFVGLQAIVNTPEVEDFVKAVVGEAAHQRLRWPSDHDAGKTHEDWFWLLGHLAGKAVRSLNAGDVEKGKHHVITSAAAMANWHAAILGLTNMRPGIEAPADATPPTDTEKPT